MRECFGDRFWQKGVGDRRSETSDCSEGGEVVLVLRRELRRSLVDSLSKSNVIEDSKKSCVGDVLTSSWIQ